MHSSCNTSLIKACRENNEHDGDMNVHIIDNPYHPTPELDRNRINIFSFTGCTFSFRSFFSLSSTSSNRKQTLLSQLGDNIRCTFEIFTSRYARLLLHTDPPLSRDRAESVLIAHAPRWLFFQVARRAQNTSRRTDLYRNPTVGDRRCA